MSLLIMNEFHIGTLSFIEDLKVARHYQHLYTHGKMLDQKNQEIGQYANYLEEFMEQVPQTFLDYNDVQKLLFEDSFHKFIQAKHQEIYDKAMNDYGHLMNDPRFHPELGSHDFSSPDMLYDEYFNINTDL